MHNLSTIRKLDWCFWLIFLAIMCFQKDQSLISEKRSVTDLGTIGTDLFDWSFWKHMIAKNISHWSRKKDYWLISGLISGLIFLTDHKDTWWPPKLVKMAFIVLVMLSGVFFEQLQKLTKTKWISWFLRISSKQNQFWVFKLENWFWAKSI